MSKWTMTVSLIIIIVLLGIIGPWAAEANPVGDNGILHRLSNGVSNLVPGYSAGPYDAPELGSLASMPSRETDTVMERVANPESFSAAVQNTITNLEDQALLQYAVSQSEKNGIDSYFTLAIIAQESRGKQESEPNTKGAVGPMQVRRVACEQVCQHRSAAFTLCQSEDTSGNMCSKSELYDLGSRDHVKMGILYISWLMRDDGKADTIQDVAAAYNGGEEAIEPSDTCRDSKVYECTRNQGYAETRDYVDNVAEYYEELKG